MKWSPPAPDSASMRHDGEYVLSINEAREETISSKFFTPSDVQLRCASLIMHRCENGYLPAGEQIVCKNQFHKYDNTREYFTLSGEFIAAPAD
jgi:hypothetical protein